MLFSLFCCLSLTLSAFAQSTSELVPDEIVSISSRIERPANEIGTAVTMIDADQIRDRGYWSVIDLLRTQPGIGVSNAGGGGKVSALRIRGEEGYRTLIRIDGIDVSDPSITQVAPIVEHLATGQALDRIEILRGTHGFLYGADAGGVIDMRSRTAAGALDGNVAVELGADSARRLDADLAGAGERADFLISITDAAADGFNSRVADSTLADDDGFDNTTLHAKVGYELGERSRVEIVLRNVDAAFEFDQCGFPATHDCDGETEQTSLRLAALWQSDRISNTIAYATTATDRLNRADGVDSFVTAGQLKRFEYIGSYSGDRTSFVYGVDFEGEEVKPAGAAILSSRQRAGYVELQQRFGEQLNFTIGARRDQNEDFGSHTSARTSLSYLQPLAGGSEIRYRASIGTGFRAPSLSELAYNGGPFAFPPAAGAVLHEESSSGYDLGLELRLADGGRYEIGYFDQQIDDEIFFDLIGFSGYLQGAGRSVSQGFELVAELPLGERWQLLGNALLNDAETVSGEARLRRPDTIVNLGFRFTSADQGFRAYANFRIVRNAVDEVFGLGRLPLDDYAVLPACAGMTSLSNEPSGGGFRYFHHL
jgi:vitamin B12 transporter